ncbi:glycine cleavage system protein R [Spartinivicinus poritis]|uniref:Glycine cleavage system transcriptional repressor n=1 Tax=Spartinivicinus poritis TaxID=2994640 RepID=A0ABT5U4Z2_9GAMM|nr:ACT domain-containing protein [Spartinivicinus sp. A2-2]MDE1461387.1 glycine cleavage system protein R [Spartinivicinus sp. A2-2]
MQTSLILSIIADDKPGLVENLSNIISQHQGNWLESRMSQMAGKFAGIVRVEIPEQMADQLVKQLENIKSTNCHIHFEVSNLPPVPQTTTYQVTLQLVGNDHPGIVKEISAALAQRHINVIDLETECSPAPMSSDMLFKAEATLQVPTNINKEKLALDLESLANELIVEINMN